MPEKPRIVWRTPLADMALAGVAATTTHVLVADRELNDTFDVFRCLDSANGKEVWAHRYPAPGALDYGNSPRATPVVDGGRVILLGAFGHLTCVELSSGTLVWQRNLRTEFGSVEELPWGVCGSPLLVDGKLIVNPGAEEASLAALDPATGNTLWTARGGPPAYGSFLAARLGGKLQLVGHDKATLGGWDVSTGQRLWTVVPPSDQSFNVPTPVVHRGRLIVTNEGHGTRIFGFADGGKIIEEPLATFRDLDGDTHTPVVSGDRLYGVAKRLFCLDLGEPGKEIYAARHAAFRRHTSLIATASRLLVCGESGELLLVDTSTSGFTLLGELKLFEDELGLLSHPALVGTRLFVRGSREIMCVDLNEEMTD